MTLPTYPAAGPCEALPEPAIGPAALTLALDLSRGEADCLNALAARWQWQPAHVAAFLLHTELHSRFMDDLEHIGKYAKEDAA